jgi:hypothetical protein
VSLRGLLAVNAIVGLVGGVGLLLAPGTVAGLLGLTLDPTATLYTRLYGAELVGFNVATWLAREAGGGARRIVVLGHVFNESLTFVVIAISLASVSANLLGVGLAGLALAFAIAFGLAAAGRFFVDGS